MRNWLESHAEGQVADFAMRTWLEAGGDPRFVIDAACRWMATNWHRQEAVYLTKELSKLDTLPVATVKDILRWCCRFPEDEDALWRLTRLFRHLGQAELDLPFVATTSVVLGARLAAGGKPSAELARQLRALFLNIGGIGLASAPLRPACDRLQQLIFRDQRTFATAGDAPLVQNRFTVDLVLTLIRVRRLNLADNADRAAFRWFVSWLAAGDENSKVWARAAIQRDPDVLSDSDLRRELADAVQPRTSGTHGAPRPAA